MYVEKRSILDFSLSFFVVTISTIVPRLLIAGGLPSTDEGYQAYYAQLISTTLSSSSELPNSGPLMLYPLLVSWVFNLSSNHMVVLRLVDLVVAAVASFIFFQVLKRASGSCFGGALISVVFLFLMNQPIFIQAGFKNSIFAAYVPLFFALMLVQKFSGEEYKIWGVVGLLVVVAVFIRETFLPFLFVGALSAFIIGGKRAFLRFTIGACLTGLVIILPIIAARGGVDTLVDFYRSAGVVYASIADQRSQLFFSNGMSSAREAMVALILGGLSMIVVISRFILGNSQVSIGHFVFWVTVSLLPLVEPVMKIGFPYHFAVCLPGLAGLTAVGWKSIVSKTNGNTSSWIAAMTVVIAIIALLPKYKPLADAWPTSRTVLVNVRAPSWPADAVGQSNYLLAADAIRRIAPSNGTLSISGFMFALYPLTGLLPPSNELSNLSATLIQLRLDEVRFKHALISCPPDVLMTTTRTDWPGTKALRKVVENSGLYQEVVNIPNDLKKSYGTFGGTIFKKIEGIKQTCPTNMVL